MHTNGTGTGSIALPCTTATAHKHTAAPEDKLPEQGQDFLIKGLVNRPPMVDLNGGAQLVNRPPMVDNCGIGLKEKLQKYQNRAARILTGATYDIRTADAFETLAWETLEKRRNYLKSIFMYKILNNLAAPNLNRMFYKMSNCPMSYNLRNSDTDLVLPQPKTEFKKGVFPIMGLSCGTI